MISEPHIIPYNPKNKLITDSDVKKIGSKFNINIPVKNIEIYIQSLTHKSYIKKEYYNSVLDNEEKYIKDNIVRLQDNSNERLEFLGDTIIKAVVSHYLFERYPNEDEGFMTKLKTKIEDKSSLAKFAKIIGLDEFIIVSKQNEISGISRVNDKILEDAFESFIGALFLDTDNFNICRNFIRYILENEIDYADIIFNDNNYKDQLLRFYHSNKWKHPEYICIKEEGYGNKKIFTIGVMDKNKNIIAKACDSSKRKAEQKVSKFALYKYNKLNEEQLNDSELDLLNL